MVSQSYLYLLSFFLSPLSSPGPSLGFSLSSLIFVFVCLYSVEPPRFCPTFCRMLPSHPPWNLLLSCILPPSFVSEVLSLPWLHFFFLPLCTFFIWAKENGWEWKVFHPRHCEGPSEASCYQKWILIENLASLSEGASSFLPFPVLPLTPSSLLFSLLPFPIYLSPAPNHCTLLISLPILSLHSLASHLWKLSYRSILVSHDRHLLLFNLSMLFYFKFHSLSFTNLFVANSSSFCSISPLFSIHFFP